MSLRGEAPDILQQVPENEQTQNEGDYRERRDTGKKSDHENENNPAGTYIEKRHDGAHRSCQQSRKRKPHIKKRQAEADTDDGNCCGHSKQALIIDGESARVEKQR